MGTEPGHLGHCWHRPTQIRWLMSQATSAIADTFQPQIGWLLSQATSIIADTSHWARQPVLMLTPSHPDQMGAEPGHQYHCWHCSTQTGWLLFQATSAIADTIPLRSDGYSTRPLVSLPTLSHWARPPVPLLTPSHPDGCWARPPLPLLTQSHPDSMAVQKLVPFLTLSHWVRPPVPLLTPSHPDRMAAEPGHQYHCWHHPTQLRWLLSQATSTIANTITPRLDGCYARPPVPLLTLCYPDRITAEPGHQYHCWHSATQIGWLLSQASSTIADTVPLSKA